MTPVNVTMFDNHTFEQWLDTNANKAMHKVTSGEVLTTEDVIILTLKAQTNHIAHLEQDLRGEMLALRQDMDRRFERAEARFKDMQQQVDKRFEQVDKRFEALTIRIDTFMKWSFASLIACSGTIIAAIKYLP